MQKVMKTRRNDGFTLIELGVVVVIIGILAAVLFPYILGGTEGAKAVALTKNSQDIANVWATINDKCATPTTSTSPILAAGKTPADVIFGGAANVATAYQSCYTQARVKPLSDAAQQNGTGWNLQGFPITVTGGGTAPLNINFATVPDTLTLQVAQRYNSGLTALAASDSTSTSVQYSTATNGTRTLTFVKPL